MSRKNSEWFSLILAVTLGFIATILISSGTTHPHFFDSRAADTIFLFAVTIPVLCTLFFITDARGARHYIKEFGVPIFFGASTARAYLTEGNMVEMAIIALLTTAIMIVWLGLWYHAMLALLAKGYFKKRP